MRSSTRRIPTPIKSRPTRSPPARGLRSRSPRSYARPGEPQPGDTWLTVASAEAAADALGPEPRRVFLSLGRLELGAFASEPHHHYIARMIDPPEDVALPPDIRLLFDRGPFDEQAGDNASHAREDRRAGLQKFGRSGDLRQDRSRAPAWHSGRDDRASAQAARTCRRKCRGRR